MPRRVGMPRGLRADHDPELFRSPDLAIPEFWSPRGRWKAGAMHTFTDDYRQEFFWRRPQEGLLVALSAGTVTAPDFTVWVDDPQPWAEFQVWRSAVIADYWLRHGVDVVPVVSFRSNCSRWVKPGSVWSVRGPVKGDSDWMTEMSRFIREAQPGLVVVFGNDPPGGLDVPVVNRRLVSQQGESIAAQKEGRF